MAIERKSVVRITVAVGAIILLCVLCRASYPITYSIFLDQVDTDPNGGDFYPEDYYKIDTDTIISSLNNGRIDVFTQTKKIPDKFWPDEVEYFQWHQSDFIKIAATLNQFAGKDNMNGWGIYSVAFDSVCENKGDGFSTGYFVLFRPIWIHNELHYQAREIFIDPLVSIVRWGHGKNYPRPLLGWDNIEIDKFKITAEQAFMIAEENGGKQARLDKGNNCNIAVIGRDDYWLVLYSEFVAEYHIDAYTGKVTYSHKY